MTSLRAWRNYSGGQAVIVVVLASLLVFGLLTLAALDDARLIAQTPMIRSGRTGYLPARERFPA